METRQPVISPYLPINQVAALWFYAPLVIALSIVALCIIRSPASQQHRASSTVLVCALLTYSLSCTDPCRLRRVTGCVYTPEYIQWQDIDLGDSSVSVPIYVPPTWQLTFDRGWSMTCSKSVCEEEGARLRWQFCQKGTCQFVDAPVLECYEG